jgi:hypothetical protein
MLTGKCIEGFEKWLIDSKQDIIKANELFNTR